MRFFTRLVRRLSPLAPAILIAVSMGHAGAVETAPHRAVYELSLAKARTSQTATSIDGRMVFLWKDVCDGWTIEYDTRMQMVFSKQGSRTLSWQYSVWEANDSGKMRFYLQRYMNGRPTLKRRGRATKGADGGKAVITRPDRREIELPEGTMFPGEHSRELLDAAASGERFLHADVFDGTGENDGLFTANAAILEAEAERAPEIDSKLLTGVASWRINLAFFAPDSRSSTPQSEQNVRYYANGIATNLRLDYGDFVVAAELTELKALERPDCG